MAIKLRLAKFFLGRTVPLDDNDIIPSNNLGTGGTGTGTKYLADDGTFKTVSSSVPDGDKGDITVTGGGSTWTIDSVDGSKVAQSASYRMVTDTEKSTWNNKEDSSNKSTSTGDSASSVKFPVWSAIVSYFSASQIRSILGITTLSGSNTGDETTATIQSKRPLKTVNSTSLEGAGNIDTRNGYTVVTKTSNFDVVNNGGTNDPELSFSVLSGGVYHIKFSFIVSCDNTTADSRVYFRTNSATMLGAGGMVSLTTASAVTALGGRSSSNFAAAIVVGQVTANLNDVFVVHGEVAYHLSANDTITVGLGNNVATAGATSRLWAGSFVEYKKIN